MDKNKIKEVIKWLREKGFSVNGGNCQQTELYDLDPDEVFAFLEDSEQFYADHYGVSKENWLQFDQFLSTMECTALLKSGRRCRTQSARYFREYEIKDFRYGENTLCRRHIEESRAQKCEEINRVLSKETVLKSIY